MPIARSAACSLGRTTSSASSSRSFNATVSWTDPTTNSAGQSFDNSTNDRTLVGYKVYWGTSQAQVEAGTSSVRTVSASPTTFVNLAKGTWHFRVVAYDGDGDESTSAASYSKVIP